MLYHKECKEKEIFVGNVRAEDELVYLQGKVNFRKGVQAIDIHGSKIDNNYMSPLFIKKEDSSKYDTIMVARSKE